MQDARIAVCEDAGFSNESEIMRYDNVGILGMDTDNSNAMFRHHRACDTK